MIYVKGINLIFYADITIYLVLFTRFWHTLSPKQELKDFIPCQFRISSNVFLYRQFIGLSTVSQRLGGPVTRAIIVDMLYHRNMVSSVTLFQYISTLL